MVQLEEILDPIEDELAKFKTLFESTMQSSNPLLNNVLSYVTKHDGKMMRPILVLLIAKLFGNITSATLHTAVALELLHTASLIHDDVVDESDKRRGAASIYAKYNNKISILSGDYLLGLCLQHSSYTQNTDIVNIISKLGKELSEGEITQLSSITSQEIDEEIYFNIIKKKTAILFASCAEAAAISVNATSDEIEKARLFGEYLGICFQIKDDIFDYFEEKNLGKPTGNDMKEGKLTLPAIHAILSSKDKKGKELAHKIKNRNSTEEDEKDLIAFTKQNGGIEYAQSQMFLYKNKASTIIDSVKDCDVKQALLKYLELVINRKN